MKKKKVYKRMIRECAQDYAVYGYVEYHLFAKGMSKTKAKKAKKFVEFLNI